MRRLALLLLLLLLALPGAAHAHEEEVDEHLLEAVRFDQRLNAQVPLDLTFTDAAGETVRLDTIFSGDRPVILSFGYYECPNLCPLIRDGLLQSLETIDFSVGEEFDVVLVSVDPAEGPAEAASEKRRIVEQYARAGSERGWHVLTGERDAIHRLADEAGFHYTYDEDSDQYAHASGIALLTPGGRVASYLFGIEYARRDLRFALIEASNGKIGSPIDDVLLTCFRYDPATGQYTVVIMNVIRLAGSVTVLLLAAFMILSIRGERRGGPPSLPTEGAQPL